MGTSKLSILFEDEYILAVHKPAGLATQTSKVSEKDLISEVTNYLSEKGKKNPYLGLINRLDQPVEGIVLFGLDKKTTANLSEQLQSGAIDKHYYAAFLGKAEMQSGMIVDFMRKAENGNVSELVDSDAPNAKKAVLEYTVVAEKSIEDNVISMADIHLITGRHHQIRLQMSGADLSLLGDRKYADEKAQLISRQLGINNIALCAMKLTFSHPISNERIEINTKPLGKWFNLFENVIP